MHVNIALIVKFMPNFFFNPDEYPPIRKQDEPRNDDFLFDQGSARGLGQIRFHDYRPALEGSSSPNVQRFSEQVAAFRELVSTEPPGPDQMKDVDFLLAAGEIFALVVYAQLILENAEIYEIEADLVDQIFDFMVRDLSKHALTLSLHPSTTDGQVAFCHRMLQKAVADNERYERVWGGHIEPLDGAYAMNA